MPDFNEENSYNSLFVKPEDTSTSVQLEQIAADINQLKSDLKEANDLLKNGKLSPQIRLVLETSAAMYRKQLKQFEEEFRNITAQSI